MRDPFDNIENWRRVDDMLSTSGALPWDEDVYRGIARMGKRTIIDLAQGAWRYSPAFVTNLTRKLGLGYVDLPIKLDAPSLADYDEFCRQIAPLENAPLHVHCTGGGICIAFLYRRALDGRGGNADSLRSVMDTVWRPGGAWAAFIKDDDRVTKPTEWSGKHYDPQKPPFATGVAH